MNRPSLILLGLLAGCSAGGPTLDAVVDDSDPGDSARTSDSLPVEDIGPALVPELTIDPPGAVFSGAAEVTLDGGQGATEIWYTLDGTPPAEGRGERYDGPLSVEQSLTLRAVAISELGLSDAAAATFVALEPSGEGFRAGLAQLVMWSEAGAPTSKSEHYSDFSMLLMEPPDGGEVAFPGEATLSSRAGLRVRGSSSSGYPKHPYRLELWGAEDDEDEDRSLMGMPAEADWILYAPLNFDRAFLRNALIYELSNQVGRYAARARFVELWVAERGEALGADDYAGVYVLMERIERDDERVDIARLDPEDVAEPEITGGYLLKEDRLGPGEGGFTAGTAGGIFTFQQPFVLVEPSEEEATAQQEAWIEDLMDELGSALAQPDFTHPTTGRHYSEIIDVDAWIDHHILNLFPKNPDAFRLSGYFHKDREEPLIAGPIWDFDRTMGCAADSRAGDPEWWDPSNITSDTTYLFEHGYWRGLFWDPVFQEAYWARLEELLASELSVENQHALIDGWAASLEEPAARNFEVWGSYGPRGGSYQAEVDLLKDWIAQRHAWISGCLELEDPRSCRGG